MPEVFLAASPLVASAYGRRRVGLRPTPKLPAAREKNLWYPGYFGPHFGLKIVNLRNRTGEERRRQTLRDKRDNNFVSNNFSPNFTFLETDLFVKDQKTLVLSEDHDKTHK